MANILVTGGAGYIGSHTCKALHAAGHIPIVVDNLGNGHRDAVQWGPFEEGDIRDISRMDEIFATHKPDAVIHFAGLIEVSRSMSNPQSFWDNNVEGTRILLSTMENAGVDKIVFSSTAAVYGTPDTVPISESAATTPVNPYGETKLAIEGMLAESAAQRGLAYVALRYFNAAGADPARELGERHNPETHLIPLVLQVALGQRDKILVFGNDYDTPDGTAVRDYVHVCDLADAHIAALRQLETNHGSLVANLGTGTGYSVREIISACRKVTGHPIPHRDAPRRAGDPAQLVAAPDLVQERLGWEARNSDLETVIQTAWYWHQSQTEA